MYPERVTERRALVGLLGQWELSDDDRKILR